MTAIMMYQDIHGFGPTLDDISEYIVISRLWFNPHTRRNGVGGANRVHTCAAKSMYKIRGQNVLDLPSPRVAAKHIRQVLMSNVVNEIDYARTSTRKSDNSVILKGWVVCNFDRYTLVDYTPP